MNCASIACVTCAILLVSLLTALNYEKYESDDDLVLIILTGGDIERLARVTEGNITFHNGCWFVANIIKPPKRLAAKQNLKQHLKKKIVPVQLKLQIVILDGQDILEVIYKRYAKRLQ